MKHNSNMFQIYLIFYQTSRGLEQFAPISRLKRVKSKRRSCLPRPSRGTGRLYSFKLMWLLMTWIERVVWSLSAVGGKRKNWWESSTGGWTPTPLQCIFCSLLYTHTQLGRRICGVGTLFSFCYLAYTKLGCRLIEGGWTPTLLQWIFCFLLYIHRQALNSVVAKA